MLNVEPRPTTASTTPLLPAPSSVEPAAPAPAEAAAKRAESSAPRRPEPTQPNPLLSIELPEHPALDPKVQLIGAMQGSGFETQQWLVQRGDGFIQVSELLYRILEQIDGTRTLDEIAAAVADATERPVSANNVRYVLQTRFVPMELIEGVRAPVEPGAKPTQAQAAAKANRSMLQLTLKLGFIGPRVIEFFARWLQYLFWPPVIAVILVLSAVAQGWLYFDHGVGTIVDQVLSHPAELLPASTFVFVSALFHEYGHASALRYGGGRARGMGFGLYIMYPAFYTDCTDSYRLSRWARLRTDLGGIYFDLMTGLLLIGLYLVTRQELWLAAVVLLDLEVADQFNPIMRFDGYWALADLVGVADFYALMMPVVRSMLPKRWKAKGQKAPPLKGWVKVVFMGYTLVTVPLLYVFFAILLAYGPALMATYYNSLIEQFTELSYAQMYHDTADLLLTLSQIGILLLTAYFMGFAVYGILRQLGRTLWKLCRAPRRRQRSIGWFVAGALAVFLWYFWVPQVAGISQSVVRIAMASQGYNVGVPGMVFVPAPETVPSPGAQMVNGRPVPDAHDTSAAVPSQGTASQPVSQPSSNTGATGTSASGQTPAKPVSDPSAKPVSDPGTHRSGNGTSNNPAPQPTPKPKPQPSPQPKPKPTRTPPTIPTLPPLPGGVTIPPIPTR